ncbi:hypothetical protein IRJ41_019691 [Triplophysa rosa]|uniref:Uncharacterized protein n=1 Tax=Triplophysa rosa TaxID=992332 RepID=A0A9W7W7Q9_TRIRA|nr:hypothetical protein IRJ41_019691 [Triplophysa rosa]
MKRFTTEQALEVLLNSDSDQSCFDHFESERDDTAILRTLRGEIQGKGLLLSDVPERREVEHSNKAEVGHVKHINMVLLGTRHGLL